MLPKPTFLGPEHAAAFHDQSIAAAYPHRPPYPEGVFETLASLLKGQPRIVLDVGCGTGDLARRLVDLADRVDAVDFSQSMIAAGRRRPGGDHPRLNWIHGRAEEVPLHPPYGLVTAGESLQWMEWDIILPRLDAALRADAYITIIEREALPTPWESELRGLIARFSTNQQFRPFNLVDELERRELFRMQGRKETAPIRVTQTIWDYVESFHSRSSLSRDRMGEAARAFDRDVEAVVRSVVKEGTVQFRLIGVLTWGRCPHL